MWRCFISRPPWRQPQAANSPPVPALSISSPHQQPHLPPSHPQAKSASHVPAKATFPNNGKQVGGKAGSAGAMAVCQRRAQPIPTAASCHVGSNGCSEADGVKVGDSSPRRAV